MRLPASRPAVRSGWLAGGLSVAVLAALLAGPAGADDWPQFRRDPTRTGASEDPCPPPLTEIWFQPSSRVGIRGAASPMSTAVAWRGRVYFVAGQQRVGTRLSARCLVCADARTGDMLWRQPLEADTLEPGTRQTPEEIGPVVSPSGGVYVHDQLWASVPHPNWRPGETPRRVTKRFPGMRAFDAATGLAVTAVPVITGSGNLRIPTPQIPRLYLLAGHGAPDTMETARPWLELGSPDRMGHPLVIGHELVALSVTDMFVRWLPPGLAGPGFLQLLRISHPVPQWQPPEHYQSSGLAGRPLALAAGGVVVGEDSTHRFVALLDALGHPYWHLDFPATLGIPAVGGGAIFLGAGGLGATRGVVAIDSATGWVGWTFPRQGVGNDPVRPNSGYHQWTRYDRLGIIFPPERFSRSSRRPPGDVLKQSAEPKARSASTTRRAPTEPAAEPKARSASTTRRAPTEPEGMWYGPTEGHLWLDLHSTLPPGHQLNPGLVLKDGQVFAEAGLGLVSLDQLSGNLMWRVPLGGAPVIRSLAASREHLYASFRDGLAAFRPEDGRLEWGQRLPGGGTLALAGGLLFLARGPTVKPASGGGLHTFAPAERTYALAVDSDNPLAYRKAPPPRRAPDTEMLPEDLKPDPQTGAPEAGGQKAEAPQPPDPGIADATVLRLAWEEERGQQVGRIRMRREAAPGLPLLLSLDWLDPKRALVCSSAGERNRLDLALAVALVRDCAALAKEAQPAYFDVAPEINVYLARRPEEAPVVGDLLRRVRAAVRRVSPATRVVLSLNVEVFSGLYGKGTWLPFGKLPSQKTPDLASLAPLLAAVDAVGLTSHPQSASPTVEQLAGGHLLRARELLGEKPVLVTRLSVRVSEKAGKVPDFELATLRRVLQLCYWLDAEVVVYADVLPVPREGEFAEKVRGSELPALGTWADAIHYRHVPRLTSPLARGGRRKRMKDEVKDESGGPMAYVR